MKLFRIRILPSHTSKLEINFPEEFFLGSEIEIWIDYDSTAVLK